jgi:phosphatidylglycerophosphate synthase
MVEPTPGELWTRELVSDLRAARYSPRGWLVFLRRSLERAAQTRDRRPHLDRQACRWAVAWLAASALSRQAGVPPRPARGAAAIPPVLELAWAIGTFTMLRWHLGMVEGPKGERRERLSPADALTLARLWLVPRVWSASGNPRLFALLLALGSASDVADGKLAARSGTTRLGRHLDTVADTCFFSLATVAAQASGWLDRRAAAALLLRYAVGATHTAAHYLTRGVPPEDASIPAGMPVVVAGLAAAPAGRRRLASLLVGASSATTLLWQLGRARVFRRHGARGTCPPG